MAIQFSCSNCDQPIEVDDQHAGQTAACPYCRTLLNVPQQSTCDAQPAVTARPAEHDPAGGWTHDRDAPALPTGVEHGADPDRQRAARTYGNYALICSGITLLLLGIAVMLCMSLMVNEIGYPPPETLNEEQVQDMLAEVLQDARVVGLSLGALFFALVGAVCAIVSLTQSARGNWRGITAVIVCGLFLLCNCSQILISLASQAAPGA